MPSIHLLTTDVSGLDLIDQVPGLHCAAVVVPQNRLGSEKLQKLEAASAARGIPVMVHPRGGEMPATLPEAESAVSWLYSQILVEADLHRYPSGILNMHGGHIPRYRGANVLQWAIINGEAELWITWHEIVEAVDAGPIWAERPIPIPPDADARDMRVRMIDAGCTLFPQAWSHKQSGQPTRIPDLSGGRVWPPRRERDGEIGQAWPERRVRDFVRALCLPWPAPTLDTASGKRRVHGIAPEAGADTLPYQTGDGGVLHLVVSGM